MKGTKSIREIRKLLLHKTNIIDFTKIVKSGVDLLESSHSKKQKKTRKNENSF